MNILFVPTKDPRLTNGGNEQRTNLLWECLKKYGKVYTFLPEQKLKTSTEMINGDHPIFKFQPTEKKKYFWYLFCSAIKRLSSLCVFDCKLKDYPNPLKVFKGVDFDLVVSRYVHPLCNYKYWEIAPLLIDIDDHPEQVYATVNREQLPIGLKKIGELLTKWQARYIIEKSKGGWVANEEQLPLYKHEYAFLPNIPQRPSEIYKINNVVRENLFTVGAMGYPPNKDGVNLFLKNIWPSFHSKYSHVEYYIVGKGASDAEAQEWNSIEGVKYLGFVENLENLYEKIYATVVPVYSGGGTCIKTLEAMSFSRMCFSTKFGVRGLPKEVIDGEKGLLVFENGEDFTACFEKVQNSNIRSEMELKGNEYIRENYSRNRFEKSVNLVVEKICNNV